MKYPTFAFTLSLFITLTFGSLDDAERSIDEIIVSHGYKFEEYSVTTMDGYFLTLHRIPSKLSQTNYIP
jgi:hypothetical protein